MAEQHTREVGNAIIVLTDMYDSFRDGHTTGYLEFYTDNRFASHGKEQIRERRARALASPVPLMGVNDLSLVKQKCLSDEREAQATQAKEAPPCGRAVPGHASRDAYPAGRGQSGETGGPRRVGPGLSGALPGVRHALLYHRVPQQTA